jgi:iron-sulfur cluster repair protein YtfE (RIC family)
MTMMYAMHDALRRDLGALARSAARRTPLLRTAAGWELFKKALLTHHLAEDEALWPAMRVTLAGKPDDLALLDAMEAEHARIDPLLDAIDAALADESRLDRLGDLTDALAIELTAHLAHEEKDALALIDATVTEQDMAAFGAAHTTRYGPDVSRILPWLLDGAADDTAELIVGSLPEPVRNTYRDAWLPAHRAAHLWP